MRVRRKSIGGMSATSAAVQTATDARHVACRGRVDRANAGMGVGRADHAHVQLMRERDVGGEAAIAGDERPIFKTRDRTADEVHSRQSLQVAGLVDALNGNLAVSDIDLVETARRLREAPIGRQRLIEQLHQQCAVHAVMADQHDGVVGMAGQHEPQRIGGARREVLQQFAVREADEMRRREPRGEQRSDFRFWPHRKF